MNSNLTYHVTVSRQDESRALAESHDQTLNLNIKKGSNEAGFNAAETLLSSFGACILTNINAIGTKMHLDIRSARVEIAAERQDKPATLTKISYRLILESPEPRQKLEELHDLCIKWGTVTNTLIQGLPLQGKLVIEI